MPLLPAEPFVYPESLLTPLDTEYTDPEARWWVLHTRPRAEKTLARHLLSRSLSFFLPVYARRWKTRGRLLSSYLPLFSGYLFLHGDADARVAAEETRLVANTLPVIDQDQFATDLAQIRHLMDADVPLTPETHLQAGTAVEIIAGSLAGLEGKIIKRGRQHTFVLEVRMLQQGVSVDIESWMFRPVKGSRKAPVA